MMTTLSYVIMYIGDYSVTELMISYEKEDNADKDWLTNGYIAYND